MPEPTDHPRIAKRMLRAGTQAPAVEAALIARGLDQPAASNVVDDALRSILASTAHSKPARSFSIAKVLIGSFLTAVAFVAMYIALASSSMNVVMGVGALPGAVRGLITGAGGGLAIGALNMVRSELMRLLK